jgi:predicted ATPase
MVPGRGAGRGDNCALHRAGFAYWLNVAILFRGWAQAEQERVEEGIAQVRHSLAGTRSLGGELARPFALSVLAAACDKLGQTDDALALVAEALAAVERSGERNWEAEIYRINGGLLLHSKRSSEADTCFRRAIEIARRQSAKSLELRATTSFARLLDKEGRQDKARRMLGEIYSWFTEGFETADLKDAKALLDALS